MKIFGRLKKPAIFLVLALLVITFVPALRFRKLENHNPLGESFSKGVFHVHSTFSDGKGDVGEISAEAAAAGLDFVMLNDHGTTNLESDSATQRVNDVLVVGGSELSLYGVHLAANGFAVPRHRYPQEPQEAIDEVNRERGISFISHPFFYANPWTDWTVEGHTGIELINAHTMASRPRFAKLLLIPRYFARPEFGLLTTLEYPRANVEAWERMNRRGRYFGIFALDAHARMSVGFGRYVNLPTYAEMFSLLVVYVKHERVLTDDVETDAASLVASIRDGTFFNCIEAIAPCNGFEAVFESDAGERLEMGGVSTNHSGRLLISLPFDFETDVVVMRNGELFRRFKANRDPHLAVEISEAGVYRVEVFARASLFNRLPWIMSNPFFLATSKPPGVRSTPVLRQVLSTDSSFFHVECDPSSECSVDERLDEHASRITELRYALPENPVTRDYSASLANRTSQSFSGFDGLMLRARTEQRTRFWLMFRTESDGGETWYRHSFAADHEWSTISVPFEEFRVHHGDVIQPDLDAVTSLFISIDNSLAYPGASGTLSIRDFGLF